MYTLKRGVALFMSAQIEQMLTVMEPVYLAFKVPLVITSGLDGPHRSDSLHYRFLAFDVRKKFDNVELSENWNIHSKTILATLRENFRIKNMPVDMVHEIDHIHAEWDEKGGKKL